MAVKTITDTDGKAHSFEMPPWRLVSVTQHRRGALIALENPVDGSNVVHQVEGNGGFERKLLG